MSTFREREASQNIVVEEPEREVVPRETARFPFSVRVKRYVPANEPTSTGVATEWLSVSCSESTTRRISWKLRPVVMG